MTGRTATRSQGWTRYDLTLRDSAGDGSPPCRPACGTARLCRPPRSARWWRTLRAVLTSSQAYVGTRVDTGVNEARPSGMPSTIAPRP
jgi:hypothetical protein